MTDTTKKITLKLQKAKANAAATGWKLTASKVFLGNFVYAEFMKYRRDVQIRLTDEDGCGRALATIMLYSDQFEKLLRTYRDARN